MSDDKTLSSNSVQGPIAFGQRLAGSQVFSTLFREGMALVEATGKLFEDVGETAGPGNCGWVQRLDHDRLGAGTNLSFGWSDGDGGWGTLKVDVMWPEPQGLGDAERVGERDGDKSGDDN